MVLKLLPLKFPSVIFKIFDALSAKSFKGGEKGCAPVWGFIFVLLFFFFLSEFLLTHI